MTTIKMRRNKQYNYKNRSSKEARRIKRITNKLHKKRKELLKK